MDEASRHAMRLLDMLQATQNEVLKGELCHELVLRGANVEHGLVVISGRPQESEREGIGRISGAVFLSVRAFRSQGSLQRRSSELERATDFTLALLWGTAGWTIRAEVTEFSEPEDDFR